MEDEGLTLEDEGLTLEDEGFGVGAIVRSRRFGEANVGRRWGRFRNGRVSGGAMG